MLSIAIFSDHYNDIEILRSIIQDFLIEKKIMAKVSYFNDPEIFLTVPGSFDIYIMDMDSKDNVLSLGNKMKTIDAGSHFIYISSDPAAAIPAAKARVDYFIMKPLENKEVIETLTEIKRKIQDDYIIIKFNDGEKRLRINNLNYINIVKRCLCYHLADGTMFDGQTLRTSFEKAIYPLQENKTLLFLSPSLLININSIKILNKDNIVFENDEILFYPMKWHDTIREAWINYSRIIN